MHIAIGSDAKTELTDNVIQYLTCQGHQVTLFGALQTPASDRWVELAQETAAFVSTGKADRGILFCWSGTGVSTAANRIKGARAALCWNTEIARLARKWNDSNILCMALVDTQLDLAKAMIEVFLNTEFDEEGFNEAYKLDE